MWFSILGAVVAGFILGIGTAFVFRLLQARTAKDLAEELFRESELQRKASLEAVLDNMKSSFGHLSLDVLAKSTDQFLKLAKSKLDAEREASVTELGAKKGLIDQQLVRMNSELENVSKLMKDNKTLEQIVASKPTADYDERVGNAAASADRFVGQLYAELAGK